MRRKGERKRRKNGGIKKREGRKEGSKERGKEGRKEGRCVE